MDHKYISEFDLVERYLMGRLAAEEIAEFESHFVDCRECIGQLNTTKALMDGFRIVASDLAPGARVREPKRFFWWPRLAGARWAWALASVVLLIAVGAVLVSNQTRRARVESDQSRNASAEWERRYREEREASSLAESRNQESERDLKTQVARLRTELENEHKRNAEEMADDHAAFKKPQINVATFELKSTRGSEPPTGALNDLVLSRAPALFVIAIPLEGEASHAAYVITVQGSDGRTIWQGRSAKPDRYNSLTVGFDSTFFREGDYVLTVSGVGRNGSASVVGTYPFRVRKSS